MDIEALNRQIAANIESLLDEKGLNKSAWAKAANLSHTVVRDIISGKTKNPTYATLAQLADAAGVPIERITIGADFLKAAEADREIFDLLLQLEPGERQFLLNAAKAQVAARDHSLEE